jgi:hypothetical protein
MAKPIGFLAFLKLLQLPDGARRAELKKKLGGGGGFQYWRPLQIVASKAILPGANVGSLTLEIDSLCSGHQRRYNQNGFEAFSKWIQGKSIEPIDPLPKIEAAFGNSGLIIRLGPDVSFKLDGIPRSMNLWATTTPLLTINALSVGLFFLAAAYKTRGHTGCQHLILDTISNSLFSEADIIPSAIHLLKDKVDAFKKDWEELNSTPPPSSETTKGDQLPLTRVPILTK